MQRSNIPVKAEKIQPVKRKDCPVLIGGVTEHFDVGDFLVCSPGFMRRQHVMAKNPEFLNRTQRKVFV